MPFTGRHRGAKRQPTQKGTAAQRCAAVPFCVGWRFAPRCRPVKGISSHYWGFRAKALHFFCRRWYNAGTEMYSESTSFPYFPIETENRPVTASRAVFCFCGCVRLLLRRRVVSTHLRVDSCRKSSKTGKSWYTKHDTEPPFLIGAKGIITPRQACDRSIGHPRPCPAEKAAPGKT